MSYLSCQLHGDTARVEEGVAPRMGHPTRQPAEGAEDTLGLQVALDPGQAVVLDAHQRPEEAVAVGGVGGRDVGAPAVVVTPV